MYYCGDDRVARRSAVASGNTPATGSSRGGHDITDRGRPPAEIAVSNYLANEGFAVVPVVDRHLPPDGRGAYYVTPYFASGSLADRTKKGAYAGNLTTAIPLLRTLYDAVYAIHDD